MDEAKLTELRVELARAMRLGRGSHWVDPVLYPEEAAAKMARAEEKRARRAAKRAR